MNLAINLDTDTAMPASFEPASTSLPERVRQAIDLLKTIITEQPTSLVLAYESPRVP
ncbi:MULTISPECIES: hypothetical protein [Halomonadaceae]|jgi:hypothetical protein|uniref:hypothetical protein n=1 Tax=Halomonadaceae TaxID=28256 RepID=UPI00022D2CA8|nr:MULTISPECIES: hypothetical protein [Halomonas]EHA15134.1 hypothetical protein HAL1_12853 [Halomonas sp. HAL1]WKV95193.1 hypothetical protein Q3Y66_20030 [Halomonas sp. HAL1]|tara:strand:+ start:539 stop:709 length:171 start_codon:yes stop_codon:yes gene_type:complete